MSRIGLKKSKRTQSIHNDYAYPMNRHKLIGWANETLSKLKSDKNFLRKNVKKNTYIDNISNADYLMTLSKKDKCVGEEISKLKTKDVATFVSETVTSKTKRKIQHMEFDSSVKRDKQKKKASNVELLNNTETKENDDSVYKLKTKHRHTMLPCSEDQEGDPYECEECTEMKKKKTKCEKRVYQNCSAFATSAGDPWIMCAPEVDERPKKKQKLTEHSKSDGVTYYCCCKCASEVNTQKKEMNTNCGRNMFDDFKYISGTRKVKKYKVHDDLCPDSKNECAYLWERVENSVPCHQDKKKQSKHTFGGALEEGEQLSIEDVPKEKSKKKKKEKNCYTHSFSEQFIPVKKKPKKCKVYTQRHKCDDSRSASELENRIGVGVRCGSPPATEENNVLEVQCVPVHKRERRKQKHDYSFNYKLEETINETHNSWKIGNTLERRKQKTNRENSYEHTVKEHKRKRTTKKHHTYSTSGIISEAKYHSDPGPGKKKKKQKQNGKDNENTSNLEDRDKQEVYSDRNNINAVEASSMQEEQKKKHKKAKKRKFETLLVSAKEGIEKERHKGDSGISENRKMNDFVDHTLLDYASTNTKYSITGEVKTGNKRKSETVGMESVNSKKIEVSSVISEETNGITGATIREGVMGYDESNLAPELTEVVKILKENDDRAKTHIIVNAHKNALCYRNVKQSRNIGTFGLSPISRLLDTESESNNLKHSCKTCCRCRLCPKIRPPKSSEGAVIGISNFGVKTEPGIKIKQEKEAVDSIDSHVTDEQLLGLIQDLPTELNTDCMNRANDGVRTTENYDSCIDKLYKQEHISAESDNGPDGFSAMVEGVLKEGTDNEFGAVGCVERFSEEDVNGSEETYINIPFHNIYDDKITIKEEISHLTNSHGDQSDGGNHEEDLSRWSSEFVGEQDMAHIDNKIGLLSVKAVGDTAEGVAESPTVKKSNESNLSILPQYEPFPLNELHSKRSLKIIPEAANVCNTTGNARETGSLYWPSVNGNEHHSSQFIDITAYTTGQVCFMHVPKWWRRGRIATALGVPIKTVYIYFNHCYSSIQDNFVTVNFYDNRCLQKIMSRASRMYCSGWFVNGRRSY